VIENIRSITFLSREIFSSIRDLFIFALLAMFIFAPSKMKAVLIGAGFTSIDYAGVRWEAQTASAKRQTSLAANQMAQIQADNQKFEDQLQSLARIAATTPQRAAIEKLSADARASANRIQTAKDTLTHSLAVQDAALRQADAKAATRAGWLVLGQITGDGSAWAPGAEKAVDANWPLAAGARVIVDSDANIHADPAGDQHTEGSVVGAIRAGEEVKIDQLDLQSSGPAGGRTVWARVSTP
jgi:hypothetical protein